MLVNDTQEAGAKADNKILPVVAMSVVKAVHHPIKNATALLLILLPRQGTFYIMEHEAGSAPTPFMKAMWPGIDIVLSLDLCLTSGALLAIAGRLGHRCAPTAHPQKFAIGLLESPLPGRYY